MSFMGGNHRARVDRYHPEAFAICDRCGFLHNHKDLRWQMEWRGNQLQKTGWLVCEPCLDVPHEFFRPVQIGIDPEFVRDARPPQWNTQEGQPPPVMSARQIIQPDEFAPPAPAPVILLEDGTDLLLEDGVGRILME